MPLPLVSRSSSSAARSATRATLALACAPLACATPSEACVKPFAEKGPVAESATVSVAVAPLLRLVASAAASPAARPLCVASLLPVRRPLFAGQRREGARRGVLLIAAACRRCRDVVVAATSVRPAAVHARCRDGGASLTVGRRLRSTRHVRVARLLAIKVRMKGSCRRVLRSPSSYAIR